MQPNTHKLVNVICPTAPAASVLALLLESEGAPSFWGVHDGVCKVVTMAPMATVRACIETVNSFSALVER